jgi:uncharacterized iron-regulated membrane protein
MFKKSILFIHRWLGFTTGLVVFMVSITGCIFCFQDEIQDALYSWRKVAIENKDYVRPSILKNTAFAKYPGATATYIYYFGNNRPAAVLADVPKLGLTYVYINPYNGKILHAEGLKENFFTEVEYIHLYLLLPAKAGRLVVGISVIIFVILMVTGIVLWWPKRKTDRKRSFTIKWNGRWRRVNYDLHNVLGFYTTAIVLVLAITGLSMAFEVVERGIYQTANLGRQYAGEKLYPNSDSLLKRSKSQPVIDRAFSLATNMSAGAQMFLIADNPGKRETINITAYRKSLHYGYSDFYFFDRYSGKLLKYLPDSKKSTGLKLNDLNFDIHVGQLLGIYGKIMAFLASLISASLPVTGFIIWLGKRKKKKQGNERTILHLRRQKQLLS